MSFAIAIAIDVVCDSYRFLRALARFIRFSGVGWRMEVKLEAG